MQDSEEYDESEELEKAEESQEAEETQGGVFKSDDDSETDQSANESYASSFEEEKPEIKIVSIDDHKDHKNEAPKKKKHVFF